MDAFYCLAPILGFCGCHAAIRSGLRTAFDQVRLASTALRRPIAFARTGDKEANHPRELPECEAVEPPPTPGHRRRDENSSAMVRQLTLRAESDTMQARKRPSGAMGIDRED
ncbi:MAG: hypothetical protein ACO1SX_28795 [Actinomycetota bacterium]